MLLNRYLPVVGGAELQASQLIQQLQARGHRVQVFTRRLNPTLPRHEVLNDVPVRRLSPVGLGHWANGLMPFRVIAYLLKKASRYDVLHVHGVGPVGLATLVAGWLTRKPVVLTLISPGNLTRFDHAGIRPSAYSRFVRRWLPPPIVWKSILSSAGAIVAISQELADEAQAMGFGGRLARIANGVDIDRFRPPADGEQAAIRKTLALNVDETILLFAGRLVAGKRIDVVITTMPQVLASAPNARLLLAGTGSLQKDDVEADLRILTSDLGIAHHVTFLGVVNDIDSYIRAANLFLFPSEREGMPNVILEAMASGVPIIASDISGVRDLLDEECAWLVPVGDVERFTQAIHEALANPAVAQKKARLARERVEQHFSLSAIAEQYEALYARLLSDKTAARSSD